MTKRIDVDEHGRLREPSAWNEDVAVELARRDGVALDARRWWLIRFVRAHWLEYGMPPLMRVVVRAMRDEGVVEDASSRTLYRLFPDGPIRAACRYAGVPPPESCI